MLWPKLLVSLRAYELVFRPNMQNNATMDMGDQAYMADLIKCALIVVFTAPILCLCPFLQRFFVKGVRVGTLKG